MSDWQIDESYALENNHFSGSLKNIFQQDKHTVLSAENNVTETQTDAPPAQASGSLKDENPPVKPTANTAATELESITVTGQRNNQPIDRYHNKISRNQIEHSATGNGDIGTALRSLPNVQFDNTQRTSKNPGEIDPAKISISGGQHYQNSFIVDEIGRAHV